MSRMARMAGLARKDREPQLDTGSTPRKQGKRRPKSRKNSDFAVLDFASARIVNDDDCQPFRSNCHGDISTRRSGAIAQLGERVVRNDEVGGSIPPGSTSLRSKPLLGEGCPSIAQRAKADTSQKLRVAQPQEAREIARGGHGPYAAQRLRIWNRPTAARMKPRGNNRSISGTILTPRPGSTARLSAIRPW